MINGINNNVPSDAIEVQQSRSAPVPFSHRLAQGGQGGRRGTINSPPPDARPAGCARAIQNPRFAPPYVSVWAYGGDTRRGAVPGVGREARSRVPPRVFR
jgi:hypothetical protein